MIELELYEEIVRLTRQGEPFALATVVAHDGSSPRKSGAKMLVRSDGSSLGTVGGGRVEKETIEAARAALADNQVYTLEFVLTEEYGYACGGSMSVFVEPQGLRPLLVMFGAGHVGRAVTALAHGCGFRVGSETYARGSRTYGVSTLLKRHVEARGSRLRFTFRGKHRTLVRATLVDPELAVGI